MGSLLLYDGDCGFCSSCARFIERHVSAPAGLVPWQFADLDPLGLTPQRCAEAVQWITAPGLPPIAGAPAVAAVLKASTKWYWRVLGRLIDAVGVRWVADRTYRWVAQNRDRMPGGTPACAVPLGNDSRTK
jgi:predicted DCC family thiol-disulfide oxidoreductase YuxK